MPPQPLYHFDTFDVNKPIYTTEEIRAINPQRFEMEQLDGVLLVDTVNHGAVGYKNVTDKEFWCRGHMPDFPLMPGVILCEAAAQMAGFYARKYNLLGGDYLGFGGMNDVRFRAPVFPGKQLVLMAQLKKLRKGILAEFKFQGFVDQVMVFSGEMLGMPINRNAKPENA